MKTTSIYLFFNALTLIFVVLLSCNDNPATPKKENIPETITKVTLQFTEEQAAGSSESPSMVTVSAEDTDGIGPQDLDVSEVISLLPNTTYTLSIDLINGLHQPNEEGYSITEEVREEGDEHQFFYAFTDNIFTNPAGNGNIDNSADNVNYVDRDQNRLPLGLQTTWTTGAANNDANNIFHILLQHQPEIKSATSSSDNGETDLDVTFRIRIQQ